MFVYFVIESEEGQAVKIIESSAVVEPLSVQKAKVRQSVCEAVLLSSLKFRMSENRDVGNPDDDKEPDPIQ